MKTIETTEVDGYVQDICRNTSLSPQERSQHAATAIRVHVMQEVRLPLNTHLLVDDDRIEHHEAHLESRAAHAMNDLMSASWEAYEYIESLWPEEDSVVTEHFTAEDLAQYEPSGEDEPNTPFEDAIIAELQRDPELLVLSEGQSIDDAYEAEQQERMNRFMRGESDGTDG